MATRTRQSTLLGSRQSLAERYDVALLDLDGVVYLAEQPVPGAAAALATARKRGMRLAFVTNNASRTPDQVAALLGKVGVPADLTAADLAAGINAAEKRIRAAVPIAETIYLEPDIYHPGQEDLADPSVAVVKRTSRRSRFRAPRRS